MTHFANRSDLEVTLLAELRRVTGSEEALRHYRLGGEVSEEQLTVGIEQLRALPTGLGYDEMMRRLRQATAG